MDSLIHSKLIQRDKLSLEIHPILTISLLSTKDAENL